MELLQLLLGIANLVLLVLIWRKVGADARR
jgi:hypothetical protein